MITFEGGPANGKGLLLRRAPTLLRVVITAGGGVDGLDQFEDEPKPGESIFVYRRRGEFTTTHFKMTCRRDSGWYQSGVYVYLGEPVDDSVLRSTDSWRRWATARVRQPPFVDPPPLIPSDVQKQLFPTSPYQDDI
jgi:hypothetical protein